MQASPDRFFISVDPVPENQMCLTTCGTFLECLAHHGEHLGANVIPSQYQIPLLDIFYGYRCPLGTTLGYFCIQADKNIVMGPL